MNSLDKNKRHRFKNWKLNDTPWEILVEELLTLGALTELGMTDYGIMDPYSGVSVIDIFINTHKRMFSDTEK